MDAGKHARSSWGGEGGGRAARRGRGHGCENGRANGRGHGLGRGAQLLVAAAGLCALPALAAAASCKVPDATHPTIQRAADDATCTEIVLEARTYTEQVTLGRSGVSLTVRGAGAGRTIIKSPTRRTASTLATTYLPGYTYVVQVRPGTEASLSGLTIDGAGNVTCTEKYFGVRWNSAGGALDDVVVQAVRGAGTNLGCTNVFAVGVTADGTGSSSVAIRRSTIRDFNEAGVLVNGTGAAATVQNTVIRGVGAQNRISQTGIWFARGGAGSADRNTISDLRYTASPCSLVGTGISVFRAGQVFVTDNVIRDVDRGLWVRENTTAQIVVYQNRILNTQLGVLLQSNGAGLSRVSANGIATTARSTLSTATCFPESGDGIAVRGEKDSAVVSNSIADSARYAVELQKDTGNLDVQQNQATRSGILDIDDEGAMNKLTLNLCHTSNPAGKCSDAP